MPALAFLTTASPIHAPMTATVLPPAKRARSLVSVMSLQRSQTFALTKTTASYLSSLFVF
ncbi:hypothetical protein FOCG_13207 [Fusarium oxysporum f. sp. radicis-lycopersici 26381]|nr:hypothetical protein FOZG_13887 [Fusarium oxysporum Fo47]EXL45855.1 hypothetical protein FOCG_13207 [Fusarium oxysporum f. sp. radicis-lycopersici 26381]